MPSNHLAGIHKPNVTATKLQHKKPTHQLQKKLKPWLHVK